MKIWLAALTLFAALTAAAQATVIAGTVTDKDTKQPIAGATVTVLVKPGPELRTTTDEAGRFQLETDAAPLYLSVRLAPYGYRNVELGVLTPAAMGDLRIPLNTKPIYLDRDFHARNRCDLVQPGQVWDAYVITPGGKCSGTWRW